LLEAFYCDKALLYCHFNPVLDIDRLSPDLIFVVVLFDLASTTAHRLHTRHILGVGYRIFLLADVETII
jgi:hypothetical protein